MKCGHQAWTQCPPSILIIVKSPLSLYLHFFLSLSLSFTHTHIKALAFLSKELQKWVMMKLLSSVTHYFLAPRKESKDKSGSVLLANRLLALQIQKQNFELSEMSAE